MHRITLVMLLTVVGAAAASFGVITRREDDPDDPHPHRCSGHGAPQKDGTCVCNNDGLSAEDKCSKCKPKKAVWPSCNENVTGIEDMLCGYRGVEKDGKCVCDARYTNSADDAKCDICAEGYYGFKMQEPEGGWKNMDSYSKDVWNVTRAHGGFCEYNDAIDCNGHGTAAYFDGPSDRWDGNPRRRGKSDATAAELLDYRYHPNFKCRCEDGWEGDYCEVEPNLGWLKLYCTKGAELYGSERGKDFKWPYFSVYFRGEDTMAGQIHRFVKNGGAADALCPTELSRAIASEEECKEIADSYTTDCQEEPDENKCFTDKINVAVADRDKLAPGCSLDNYYFYEYDMTTFTSTTMSYSDFKFNPKSNSTHPLNWAYNYTGKGRDDWSVYPHNVPDSEYDMAICKCKNFDTKEPTANPTSPTPAPTLNPTVPTPNPTPSPTPKPAPNPTTANPTPAAASRPAARPTSKPAAAASCTCENSGVPTKRAAPGCGCDCSAARNTLKTSGYTGQRCETQRCTTKDYAVAAAEAGLNEVLSAIEPVGVSFAKDLWNVGKACFSFQNFNIFDRSLEAKAKRFFCRKKWEKFVLNQAATLFCELAAKIIPKLKVACAVASIACQIVNFGKECNTGKKHDTCGTSLADRRRRSQLAAGSSCTADTDVPAHLAELNERTCAVGTIKAAAVFLFDDANFHTVVDPLCYLNRTDVEGEPDTDYVQGCAFGAGPELAENRQRIAGYLARAKAFVDEPDNPSTNFSDFLSVVQGAVTAVNASSSGGETGPGLLGGLVDATFVATAAINTIANENLGSGETPFDVLELEFDEPSPTSPTTKQATTTGSGSGLGLPDSEINAVDQVADDGGGSSGAVVGSVVGAIVGGLIAVAIAL